MKFKRRFVKKFKYNYKTRFLLPLFLLVCVSLGLGYAYLQTDLAIVGVTKLKDNEWNVHFDNVQPVPGSVEPVTAPSISDLTTVSFSAQLENPGDKYEFYIDVVNSGTIDAMVDSLILLPELTTDQAKYLSYEVTYRGGAPISQHELLTQGQTKTLKVSFKYVENSDTSNYPQENTTFNISATVNYVQANNQAVDYIGANPCTYNGELVQCAEYVNGQYTYRYKQQVVLDQYSGYPVWESISEDGWGVELADKNSTSPVTTPLCSSINNKPIVSMSNMIRYGSLSSIDLSSFDTSNVTNMIGMFGEAWGSMTSVDVSTLDTSNVTDMSYMFSNGPKPVGLEKMNTSNVTNMSYMFFGNEATSLDLSGLDTSNVTNMSHMFSQSSATSINITGLDTSNVTDMSDMFSMSHATTLDFSNFDTSNVTNMHRMFASYEGTALDLSSFNTSNVTNMREMFSYCQATSLNLSNFDIRNVTNMWDMFEYSQATTLDLSSFDTSNITIPGMFYRAAATTGYGRTQADCDKFNASYGKPAELTFVVKGS